MLQRTQMNNYSLDDWKAEFDEIYGADNGNRSIETIWLHAIEHASQLHEDLRIAEYQNAFGHIADLFCWLCAFTTKAHSELGTKNSLLDIVLCKYPRICFYCGGKQCFCSAMIGRGIEDAETKAKLEKEALKRAEIERGKLRAADDEPKSLQEVVEMFQKIYDHINFRTPLEVIMAHLQEEVGEVATCVNDFVDKDLDRVELCHELEREIADVVTWTTALFLKLDYLLGAGRIYLIRMGEISSESNARTGRGEPQSLGITFPMILWRHFQTLDKNTLWCPSCKTRPCALKLHKRSAAHR